MMQWLWDVFDIHITENIQVGHVVLVLSGLGIVVGFCWGCA